MKMGPTSISRRACWKEILSYKECKRELKIFKCCVLATAKNKTDRWNLIDTTWGLKYKLKLVRCGRQLSLRFISLKEGLVCFGCNSICPKDTACTANIFYTLETILSKLGPPKTSFYLLVLGAGRPQPFSVSQT